MPKHIWKKDEHGDVDEMAWYVEAETMGHSGPECLVCKYQFCIHGRNQEEYWNSECPREAEDTC